MAVKMMATREVPWASCWVRPSRRTADGTITTPPPIPAKPAKNPATNPIPTATATWVRSVNSVDPGSGLAPVIMRRAATSRTRPNTTVNALVLLRCMIVAPMTEPRMPPIPTVTPRPTSISPDRPNEKAPAAAMRTIAASDVAWDRCRSKPIATRSGTITIPPPTPSPPPTKPAVRPMRASFQG